MDAYLRLISPWMLLVRVRQSRANCGEMKEALLRDGATFVKAMQFIPPDARQPLAGVRKPHASLHSAIAVPSPWSV